ncbi:MAG: SixA phosphatase family protein [Streptosporangiaceae bacterium]
MSSASRLRRGTLAERAVQGPAAMPRHRKLVLLRHAKSSWPDVPDQERPLARRGVRDAPAVGRWLRMAGHSPDLVLCSTAHRAQQTWQLAATELPDRPAVLWDERVYQASAAGLLNLIRQVPPETRILLVVGHDPAIPGLARMLAAGAMPGVPADPAASPAPGALDRLSGKFPTAAAAVLDVTVAWPDLGPGQARLEAFVTPHDNPARARDQH